MRSTGKSVKDKIVLMLAAMKRKRRKEGDRWTRNNRQDKMRERERKKDTDARWGMEVLTKRQKTKD